MVAGSHAQSVRLGTWSRMRGRRGIMHTLVVVFSRLDLGASALQWRGPRGHFSGFVSHVIRQFLVFAQRTGESHQSTDDGGFLKARLGCAGSNLDLKATDREGRAVTSSSVDLMQDR